MDNPYAKYLKGVKLPNKTSNDNPYAKYLSEEDRNKFSVTTKDNPGKNLSNEDRIEAGAFDDNPYQKYLPKDLEKENIDGDADLWDKVAFATKLGFFDTVRGVSQITDTNLGFGNKKQMQDDQKKLYEYMENEDGSTNYLVAAAYFGSAILDPAGWLIPVTKTRTLYKAAKYGFVSAGIAGGLGYVDEESILDTRGKQAAASAVGGFVVSPVIKGIGMKLKGQKVFTKESLGIPGFDSPTIKTQADVELQKVKLQNEAGKKFRDANARKKIEIDDPEMLKDMPANKTKMLQGPRLWFRENVVKPYEEKFGKPALNYLTNGEYGAEAGAAGTGGLIGFISADDEAPITTKFGRAVAGALIGAGGIKASRAIDIGPRTFAKGEAETEEISETLYDWLGRQFIDGYGLPKEFKALKAEAQGYSNHIAMRFAFLADKIKRNLTKDEQKILHNLIQGDTKLKVAPATLQNLSQDARRLINEVSQEYIDAGLITRKTFEENKNKYLKRSYRGKLEDRPFGEELKLRGATERVTKEEYLKIFKKQKAYTTTSEVRPSKGLFKEVEGKKKLIKGHKGWELLYTSEKQLKKLKKDDVVEIRWQFTKPQRVGLSEIEDASYAIAETGRAFSSTLSQYRFYKNISKTDYVYNTLGSVPKELRDKYRMMPTTEISKASGKRRFGELAGKYVPEEVYKSLVAANRYVQTESKSFYKGYRKLNSVWKVSKTAWNPTVHVNNIMSNFVLHDLVDAELKYLPKAWTALTTHGKKNKLGKLQRSELVETATKYGVFDADFVTTELKNIQGGTKFPYGFDENLDAFRNSVRAADNIYRDGVLKNKLGLQTLTEWYRFEDSVFRLSVFQDRLAKGYSAADAALDARKSFIDYNIDAPAINWMRNTVTPFLAYTYRIVPLLAETAIVRPWKYAKYAALGYGLNQMGDLVGGGDEEAERAVMPERKQGRFINLPFLPYRNIKLPLPPDEEGNPYYMDFTRFVPGGDVLDLNGTLPGVPAPLQPSGGLAGELLFPLVGYDLFRQKKIEGQTGIPNEDWAVRLKTIRDKLTPNIPFLPGSYSSEKLERTRKGSESLFRPQQSEFVSLAQALGFKVEKADLETLSAGKAFELKRKLNGFKEQINLYRKKLRDGLITQETAQKEIDKIAVKMRELSEKYNVAFEKATYANPEKGLFERRN